MEQSPSWEAIGFSACQEIPCILWNPNVHHRIQKSPPHVCILSQINSIHPPHPTSWRAILLLSSHPLLGLRVISVPQTSPAKPCIHLCSLPYVLHARPTVFHSLRFGNPNNIWRRVQVIKLLIMYFLHSCVTLSLLGQIILLNTLFSNTFSLRSSLNMRDQVWHPYQKNRQNYSSVNLNLYIFG